MHIQLSDHFDYKRLIRFTLPSVVMMIFTSIYGVIDGIFVSNFVGKTPFAAINLIMPVCMIFGSIGFMIGTGGSALVSMTLGRGEGDRANKIFSMLVYVSIIAGAILSFFGFIFIEPISRALGAEGEMLDYCVTYGRIIIPASVAFILQSEFQSFLVTAERPKMGLYITVAAGCTNILLDALFVSPDIFNWGLEGAAFATVISQCVGALIPLVYFFISKKSPLRLTRTRFYTKSLLRACANGSSEMMTNLSMSVVNILYNFQLMRFEKDNGIAAYGVIMYINFIFVSIFIGFSFGSAPIIGFHYGAQNHSELQSLRKKCFTIIAVCSGAMLIAAELLASPLSGIFVGYDPNLHEITKNGFMLFSLSFLFLGFNIFTSSFFTALNNGPVSATISFLRTLVLQILAIFTLPILFGLNGIWLSIVFAEAVSLLISFAFIIRLKKRYNY